MSLYIPVLKNLTKVFVESVIVVNLSQSFLPCDIYMILITDMYAFILYHEKYAYLCVIV